MARPDSHIVWQAEEFLARLEKVMHIAAREITTCSAQIKVKDGVSAEDIIYRRLLANTTSGVHLLRAYRHFCNQFDEGHILGDA